MPKSIFRIMKPLFSSKIDYKTGKIDEDHLESLHDEGYSLLEAGNYKKSLTIFNELLDYIITNTEKSYQLPEVHDSFLDALYHKAEIYSELGKNREALRTVDEILSVDPKFALGIFMKAYVLSELKQDKAAIKWYKKFLQMEPKDSDAMVNISNSLMSLKDYKDAVRFAEKAIKIKPSDIDAWYNKAESLMELGNYKDAKDAFTKILKKTPEDGEVWYMKARCLVKIDKKLFDDALDSLLVAVSIEPQYKKKARMDKYFSGIRNSKRFKKIIR